MRIIVFGTGRLYIKNKPKLLEMNIIAFLDNNVEKQGTYLDGILIDSPQNIINYEYDYIVIASIHYKEMRAQLERQGIDGKLIIDAENKGDWKNIRKIEYYDLTENCLPNKKILFVTHDFSLSGAPMMLYYAAKVFKEEGYGVTVYSKANGKLKYDYLMHRISVKVFEDYDFSEEEICQYFSQYQLILVNTIVLFKLVGKLQKLNIPILWWLHEEDNAYEGYNVDKIPFYKNLYVYGVGNRVVNAYIKHSGNSDIKQLVYGIPKEIYSKKEDGGIKGQKIVCAIIGTVMKRKGHDIFIASIEKNWMKWKDKADFWVIGAISELQEAELEKTQKIRVFKSLDHNDLIRLYSKIDVVVCPSRNDPMPVVLAEAMMNKKVCIASDMTGIAEKISPYKNGLICHAGDVDSLSDQIDWVINNKDKLKDIGERAYDIYEKNFSQEQFRENILKIVENVINVKEFG